MIDSWNLKQLFKFDKEYLRVFNDTDEDVEYIGPNGKKAIIKKGGIIHFKKKNEGFDIPNTDTLKFSNKTIYEVDSFDDNLQLITRVYRDRMGEGQIIQGLNFIEYHYKWAKKNRRKKDFLNFIKYYFLSKHWLPIEKREKDWLIEEWIKNKELEIEKPKYLWGLALIVMILILGLVFLCNYRQLILGALLGLIFSQVGKLIDNIFRKN